MNKFIKEQLLKCRVAEIPEVDDSVTEIIIPKKGSKPHVENVDLLCGGRYDIEVADYIIKPYKGFDLHERWNDNRVPTDKQMDVVVDTIRGSMVLVHGKGIHDGKYWGGYLPKKSFKVIRRNE